MIADSASWLDRAECRVFGLAPWSQTEPVDLFFSDPVDEALAVCR